MFPSLPEEVFTGGGITLDEFSERFSTHTDAAASAENQFFAGTWKTNTDDDSAGGQKLSLNLQTDGDAVSGTLTGTVNEYDIEHLQLIGNRLRFTIRMEERGWENTIIEVNGVIENDRMQIELRNIENNLGSYTLFKQ